MEVFYKIDSSNGAQIGSRFMSNNAANCVGYYTNGMILNNNKIYIAYYWTEKRVIVYDIQSNSFTNSYERSLAELNFNSIIINDNRLFIFGWNTYTILSIISSAKLADLSLIPNYSPSSFGMNMILTAQYSLSQVTITITMFVRIN